MHCEIIDRYFNVFFVEIQLKKNILKSVFWAPEFGRPNQYNGLLNGLNMSLDIIADMSHDKRFQSLVKELFTRCRKLNISLLLITQSYFPVLKDVRLKSTHYLILIHNKRELQSIAVNHSSDTDYKDFMEIYRRCTKKTFSFLTIDTKLPTDDILRFS